MAPSSRPTSLRSGVAGRRKCVSLRELWWPRFDRNHRFLPFLLQDLVFGLMGGCKSYGEIQKYSATGDSTVPTTRRVYSESGRVPREWLNIFRLILIHPEIVAQFMDDRQPDLFADFGLAGADRFNILLIKHDVIGPGRQVKYVLLAR